MSGRWGLTREWQGTGDEVCGTRAWGDGVEVEKQGIFWELRKIKVTGKIYLLSY